MKTEEVTAPSDSKTKNIVLQSATAAFLGSLALLAAQTAISYASSFRQYRIDIDQSPKDTYLSAVELQSVMKSTSDNNTNFAFNHVSIKNTGYSDISNRSFSAVLPAVKYVQIYRYPFDNPHNAQVSYAGKVLTIKTSYFPVNSSIEILIATDVTKIVQNIAIKNDSPGIVIRETRYDPSLLNKTKTVFSILSLAGGVIVGMLVFAVIFIRRERNELRGRLVELAQTNQVLGALLRRETDAQTQ